MSTANDKSSKEATGLVVEILSPNKGKANGPNNYLAWEKRNAHHYGCALRPNDHGL